MKQLIFIISIIAVASASFAQRREHLPLEGILNGEMSSSLMQTPTLMDTLKESPLGYLFERDLGWLNVPKGPFIQLDGSFSTPPTVKGHIFPSIPNRVPLPLYDREKQYNDPYYPVVPGRVFPDDKMIIPHPIPKDDEREGTPLRNFPNWRIEKLKNIGAIL